MAEISIIVPVYNIEIYLNRCIDSILNQNYKDFELILIDDESTDNSGKICDNYAAKDNRVVVIHQKNHGAGSARNAGLDWAFKNSKSNWITFIDSDDWIHKDYLKIMLDTATKSNIEIIATNYKKTYDNCDDVPINAIYKIISIDELHKNHILKTIHPHCKLIKKELFKNIRFPNIRVCEDTFTIFKVILKCKNIALVDNYLYYYFVRQGSLSHSKNYDDVLSAIAKFDENLIYYQYEPKETYAMVCLHYAKYSWSNYNKIKDNKYKKQKLLFKKYSKKYLKLFHKAIKTPIYINAKKYNTSYLYETTYPNFMKFYWFYRGVIHKFKSITSKPKLL